MALGLASVEELLDDQNKDKDMMTAKEIIAHMESLRNEEQRRILMGFFKTGPGEYGEGDEFLGLKKMSEQERKEWMTT